MSKESIKRICITVTGIACIALVAYILRDNKSESATLVFTLHWKEPPRLEHDVTFTYTSTPQQLLHTSSTDIIGRREIDGRGFNGVIIHDERRTKEAKHEGDICEFFVRRVDKRTIEIYLRNKVAAEIRSDDADSALSSADGKSFPWGIRIEPGDHRLRATLNEEKPGGSR